MKQDDIKMKVFYPINPSLSREISDVNSCPRLFVSGGFVAPLAIGETKATLKKIHKTLQSTINYHTHCFINT